jgi:hypothetical protein
MRLTAELMTQHVLSPRMTHSAIGSESCNVREMFTTPYPVVVFPPSLNALYIPMPGGTLGNEHWKSIWEMFSA